MIIHINVPAIFPLAIALAYNSYLAMFMGCAGLGGSQPVLHLQDSPQLGPSEKIQFWSGVNKPYLTNLIPGTLKSTFFTAAMYFSASHFTPSIVVSNLSIIAALISLLPLSCAIYLILPEAFALMELDVKGTMTGDQQEEVEVHMTRWNAFTEFLLFAHAASWLAGAGALIWIIIRWIGSWFW